MSLMNYTLICWVFRISYQRLLLFGIHRCISQPTVFQQSLPIDPYIRRFVSSKEHSHHRYFIASRHILCLMIFHLGIVLPTSPSFTHIHTVIILCMLGVSDCLFQANMTAIIPNIRYSVVISY